MTSRRAIAKTTKTTRQKLTHRLRKQPSASTTSGSVAAQSAAGSQAIDAAVETDIAADAEGAETATDQIKSAKTPVQTTGKTATQQTLATSDTAGAAGETDNQVAHADQQSGPELPTNGVQNPQIEVADKRGATDRDAQANRGKTSRSSAHGERDRGAITRPATGATPTASPTENVVASADVWAAVPAAQASTGQATPAVTGMQETSRPDGDKTSADAASPAKSATSAERLPDHLFARGTSRSDHTGDIAHVDQSRVIQRVARAIHAALQRGGTIRLRLSPPELGSLRMEVSMHNGTLSARLETETHAARGVLLDNLPQLRDRLEQQGLRVEHFEVNVSQRDAGDSQRQGADAREAIEMPQGSRLRPAVADTSPEGDIAPRPRRFINQGNLNVVI